MPAIECSDEQVRVQFRGGCDDDVLQRVFGWVHWREAQVRWVRCGDRWQVDAVEMVASRQVYESVVEILTGDIRPQLAGHRGQRVVHELSAAGM